MNALIQSLEALGANRCSTAAANIPPIETVRSVMAAPANLPCMVAAPPLGQAAATNLRSAA